MGSPIRIMAVCLFAIAATTKGYSMKNLATDMDLFELSADKLLEVKGGHGLPPVCGLPSVDCGGDEMPDQEFI